MFAFKVAVMSLAVCYVAANATGKFNNDDDEWIASNYTYGWGVADQEAGVDASHHETRQQYVVKGEYRVLQPDGCVRIVSYTAGDEGFNPVVRYEGNCNPENYQAPINQDIPETADMVAPTQVEVNTNVRAPTTIQMTPDESASASLGLATTGSNKAAADAAAAPAKKAEWSPYAPMRQEYAAAPAYAPAPPAAPAYAPAPAAAPAYAPAPAAAPAYAPAPAAAPAYAPAPAPAAAPKYY